MEQADRYVQNRVSDFANGLRIIVTSATFQQHEKCSRRSKLLKMNVATGTASGSFLVFEFFDLLSGSSLDWCNVWTGAVSHLPFRDGDANVGFTLSLETVS